MAYIKSLFYRERAAELYYEVDERQNCHQSRDNYRNYVGNRLLAIFAFAGDNSDGSFLPLRYADADKSREPYCLRHGLVDEEDDGRVEDTLREVERQKERRNELHYVGRGNSHVERRDDEVSDHHNRGHGDDRSQHTEKCAGHCSLA